MSKLKHGKKLSDYKLEINLEDLPLDLKLKIENICDDYVKQSPADANGFIGVKKLLTFLTTYDSIKVDQIMDIFGCINVNDFLEEDK